MTKLIGILIVLVGIGHANEVEYYIVPPTSSGYSTSMHDVISDEAMKQCVKLYNEALVIEKKLKSMVVDQYSEISVNTYNAEVMTHKNMISSFNRQCAGKQSQSAYEQAQKLNAERQQRLLHNQNRN